MWLLVAPRAAQVLMVMRASVPSRLILASAPRNGAVRGSQPETTARKSGRRLTRRCPVALQPSLFPLRRLQRAPQRPVAIARRRHLAASGPMPPALACKFTVSELAVL